MDQVIYIDRHGNKTTILRSTTEKYLKVMLQYLSIQGRGVAELHGTQRSLQKILARHRMIREFLILGPPL